MKLFLWYVCLFVLMLDVEGAPAPGAHTVPDLNVANLGVYGTMNYTVDYYSTATLGSSFRMAFDGSHVKVVDFLVDATVTLSIANATPSLPTEARTIHVIFTNLNSKTLTWQLDSGQLMWASSPRSPSPASGTYAFTLYHGNVWAQLLGTASLEGVDVGHITDHTNTVVAQLGPFKPNFIPVAIDTNHLGDSTMFQTNRYVVITNNYVDGLPQGLQINDGLNEPAEFLQSGAVALIRGYSAVDFTDRLRNKSMRYGNNMLTPLSTGQVLSGLNSSLGLSWEELDLMTSLQIYGYFNNSTNYARVRLSHGGTNVVNYMRYATEVGGNVTTALNHMFRVGTNDLIELGSQGGKPAIVLHEPGTSVTTVLFQSGDIGALTSGSVLNIAAGNGGMIISSYATDFMNSLGGLQRTYGYLVGTNASLVYYSHGGTNGAIRWNSDAGPATPGGHRPYEWAIGGTNVFSFDKNFRYYLGPGTSNYLSMVGAALRYDTSAGNIMSIHPNVMYLQPGLGSGAQPTFTLQAGQLLIQASVGTANPLASYGYLAGNTDGATSSVQANSPGMTWRGQGWSTNLNATESVSIGAHTIPSAGGAHPSGILRFTFDVGGLTNGTLAELSTQGSFRLVPITKAQKTQIVPQEGMLVMQSDTTPGLRVYQSGAWRMVSTVADP